MGFLEDTYNKAKNALGFGDDDLDKPLYKEAESKGLLDASGKTENRADWFKISGENWYQTFPYQFVVKKRKPKDSNSNDFITKAAQEFGDSTSGQMYYTLPIPPQALSVKMIPASQVTPTVGGVVEETSANVFWLINMNGTTGIGIGRNFDDKDKMAKMATQFRQRVSATGELSGLFSSLGAAVAKFGNTADALIGAYNSFADGEIGAGIGGISGALQNSMLPNQPYGGSAVHRKRNGFTEALEMQRFLLIYSKLKGAYPDTYYLRFRMYQTGQEWDCAIQDFSLQKTAANPMAYRYNITLKCWNIRPVDTSNGAGKAQDRFAPGGDLGPVNIVSMKEVKNAFGKKSKKK
jgi:hypothetical protein